MEASRLNGSGAQRCGHTMGSSVRLEDSNGLFNAGLDAKTMR